MDGDDAAPTAARQLDSLEECEEDDCEYEFTLDFDADAEGGGGDAAGDGDDYEYGYGFDGEDDALRAVARAAGGENFDEQGAGKRRPVEGNHERGEPAKKLRRDDDDDDDDESAYSKFMDELSSFGLHRRRRKRGETKKKGRKKNSRKNLNPEVSRKLGDATLHYSQAEYKEAIASLHHVVRLAPNLPDSFHLLGLIYDDLGERKKAFNFLMIAAHLSPKDVSLWLKLLSWSMERKDSASVKHFLLKATRADPNDIPLKFDLALLYVDLGDYRKAAELYEQIYRSSQDDSHKQPNTEALKMAAKLYRRSGQIDKAISLLEPYVSIHMPEAIPAVLNLLITFYIETNAHCEAIKQIERACLSVGSKDKLPLAIQAKRVICCSHLGDMTPAEIFYNNVQKESTIGESVYEVANAFASMGQYNYALKFYLLLEKVAETDKGSLFVKIAECYLSVKQTIDALSYFYKALQIMDDSVDLRITISSVLVEEGKEDEAIRLLLPPENVLDLQSNEMPASCKQWWLDRRIKMQLGTLYRCKGMLEKFANSMFPLVHDTLKAELVNMKWRPAKRVSTAILNERTKVLGEQEPDIIFHGPRPIATATELQKANRAKRKLEKLAAEKEEKRAAAMSAGLDWQSEESEEDVPRREKMEPPIPGFFADAENHQLLIELCKALATSRQYWEALQIINSTIKVANDALSNDKMEELRSLGAQIAYSCVDPKHGFKYVRHMVQKHPSSVAAWNCFYKVFSRLEDNYASEVKFLHRFRHVHGDCVPPIVICGHQFTAISQHQAAAEDYLRAYKLQPDNPFINLCVGSALINLSLGFRLQNKHHTIVQGFAFLYKYLHLCNSSQEALYNVARAHHHVGLVTLAVMYYEKVLAMEVDDHPLPKLPYEETDEPQDRRPGYCDLRREAAYNLHLIYKKSGAVDLARDVLKRYCVL